MIHSHSVKTASARIGHAPRSHLPAPFVLTLLTLLALLSGMGQSVASATPWHQGATGAVAPVGTGNLVVSLSRFRPSIPNAESTLDVRGSLTNVSATVVRDVRVALRISPTPLYNRSEIQAVLSGDTTREGIQFQSTLTDLSAQLPPGGSVDFQLELPLSQVSLPQAGVYVTAVEALGDSGSGLERQALYRTFLPWWPPETTADPLGVTMLWPITGPADRDGAGIFMSEELGLQMSTTGRLETMVTAAAKNPAEVTWVVDPQVIQAASRMSQGYAVYTDSESPNSPTVPGTRPAEAGRWLTNLVTAVSDSSTPLMASLYADPDVDAAKRGKALGSLLSQRRTAELQMTATLGRNYSGVLVVAPGGNADPETISTLDEAGITGLVLSADAMPAQQTVNYTRTGSAVLATDNGDIPVLLLDPGLREAMHMPATSSTDAIALRQRMLAETAVSALEAPNLARILVTAPPSEWSPSKAVAQAALRVLGAPWVVPITASAMLASPESTVSRSHATLSETQIAQQLPEQSVAQVRTNQRNVTEYKSMLTHPNDVPPDLQQAPSRQLSAYFRGRENQWAALSANVSAQVTAAVNSVSVVSSGSVTISGQSGTIPVTVSNNGLEEVTVGLQLTSRPPQLFQAEPVSPFPIDPGRRTSIEVKAQVAGSIQVPVEIQLVSVDGRPIGSPTTLLIRSAAYARAAQLLVQLSLVLFVLAVLVHGIRRARRAGRGAVNQRGE